MKANIDRDSNSLMDLVEVKHCETARQFMDALSPRIGLFRDWPPGLWIYRGHEDDRFRLVPSALRPCSQLPPELFPAEATTNHQQAVLEQDLLRHFFNLADEAGFHLPEDVRMVRVWVNRTPEKDREWIIPELLSIVALAQHHGVPTRLLDWSRNAYKAALFAALGALDKSLDGGRLSVWATSIRSVETYGSFDGAPFTVVTASGGLNRHLAAQEGVFTYSGKIKTNGDEVDRRSLDEIAREFFKRKGEVIEEPWFHHVTLPHSQASELCVELFHQGISYPSIYPNLDAVVKTMKFVRSRAPLP